MNFYITDGDGVPQQDAEGCACLKIRDTLERWYPFSRLHHIPAARVSQLMQSVVYRYGTRPKLNGRGHSPGDAGLAAATIGDYCRRFPYGVVEVFGAHPVRYET